MRPARRRRHRRAGLTGALGAPLALVAALALGMPLPRLFGSTAAAPAANATGPLAIDGAMVTGPVDDPIMQPRLAERLELGVHGPPYACISPQATTTTGGGAASGTATSTSTSTTTTVASTTNGPLRPHGAARPAATSTTTSTSTTLPATTLPGVPGSSTTTLPSQATVSSAPVTTYSPTSTTTPVVVPGERVGYDLLQPDGLVSAFGGAGEYGPKRALKRGAVSIAVTVDGAGYWLLSADGKVANFGDAIDYGEPARLGTGRTVAIVATPDGGGYWLLSSKGGLDNFGDAPFCGSAVHAAPAGPYVAMAAMPDGDGYWLVTSNGTVHAYGDAPTLAPTGNAGTAPSAATAGSSAGSVSSASSAGAGTSSATGSTGAGTGGAAANAIVSIAATPDGGGYWLLSAHGSVTAYGDAHYYGGGGAKQGVGTFVGIAPTTDGKGYWLATSEGRVFQFGDATADGSFAREPAKAKVGVVALAAAVVPPPAPAGATGTGATGSATTSTSTSTSTSTTTTTRPVPTTTAAGAHHATTTTLAHPPTTVHHPPTTTVAPPTTTAPRGSSKGGLPPGSAHRAFGYDVSDFQCAKPGSSAARSNLPAHSGISIIQVAGWLDSGANPCIAAEAAWAVRAGGSKANPYQLYLFMNSPGTNAVGIAQSAKGPAGTCDRLAPAARPSCIAYNYGYNGAVSAVAYAASHGVRAAEWWLDIENSSLSRSDYSDFAAGQYWSGSTALNDRTITGAIAALRRAGIVVGIYSTSVQYPKIAGNFVPSGAPVELWVAGVPWTSPPFSEHGLYSPSVLAPWCAGKAGYVGFRGGERFAGGVVQLLQETPGTEPSPYGLDPDYAC